ncbi:recombinase family protein [Streptomyces smyrnaeus]|uniref:recombinase family protein n=1 Tax=Streptomyces smyrnaeus TaxID=1387713 RepID=UPI003677E1E3
MTTTQAWPATFDGPEAREPFIGYIRVSTWREEKISPELQETAIRAWAARTGRRIVEPLIIDLDATGRNFKRRIMRGIERVEAGEARGIAVWKYSRFGRNDTGIAINLARLERVGGQLESATEEIDASTAVGKFNRAILFDLAVFESDRAGEQWSEAHQWRRDHGLPATGKPRLGYVWHPRRIPHPERLGEWLIQDERYEIHPEAGPIVERLYLRKIGGDGFAVLSEWLNGLGYRTSRGRKWQADSLRRFMDAGFAAGLLRIHDPSCRCDYTANGGRCTRWTFIDGAHEAIISPEIWERYEEHRKETRARFPRARKAKYTLTALARCGECRGSAAFGSARRRGQQVHGYALMCYTRVHSGTSICSRGVWVKRITVEEEVRGWLAREAADGIDAAPPVSPHEPTPAVDERELAAAERTRLQAHHDKLSAGLTRLRADRAINPDDYSDGEYEAARDHIKEQLRRVQHQLEQLVEVEQAPARADFTPLVVGLLAEWETLEPRERNEILRKLVRRVVCTRIGTSDRTAITVHPLWEPDPWADDQSPT